MPRITSGRNALGERSVDQTRDIHGSFKFTDITAQNIAEKKMAKRPMARGVTSVVSPAVVYDFKSQNSIDAFLTMNGTHDYFSYAIVPCIAFAQEYITLTFNEIAFGDEDEVVLPGAVDYACRQYIHLLLPGIVGTHSVSGTAVGPSAAFNSSLLVAQTTYPYVMGSQNGAAGALKSTTGGATRVNALYVQLDQPVNGIIATTATATASGVAAATTGGATGTAYTASNICNSITDSTSIWLDSKQGVHGSNMTGASVTTPVALSALPGIPGVHILDRTLEEQMYMYLYQTKAAIAPSGLWYASAAPETAGGAALTFSPVYQYPLALLTSRYFISATTPVDRVEATIHHVTCTPFTTTLPLFYAADDTAIVVAVVPSAVPGFSGAEGTGRSNSMYPAIGGEYILSSTTPTAANPGPGVVHTFAANTIVGPISISNSVVSVIGVDHLPLTFNMYAHYCYGAGYRAIESLVMIPGFGEAEILDYHYIYMWEELSGEAGRRDVYTTGCAPTRDELIRMSLDEQHLYINIPWWFTYAYENPLVMTTTQLTDMTFSLQLAQLSDLIVVSDAFTIPVLSQRDENAALWVNDNRAVLGAKTYDQSFALDKNCLYYPFVDPRNPQDIQLLDHKPRVVAVDLVQQVIYLEDTLHEQLRQQAQSPVFAGLCVQNCSLHQRITNYDGYDYSIPMSGDNPVIEYIVFVTLEANEYQNDWFDSSRQGPSQGWGSHLYDSRYISNHEIRGRDNMLDVDPIQSMMLEINNNQRWHRAPAAEYRVMQQAIHHSSVVNAVKTRNYYHNVCFATYPEEGKQYSGSSNLGKVGVHRLNIQFDESLATLLTPSGLIQSSVPFTCHVYGRVFAVWDRDSKRLSGPRYALKFDLAARV